VKLGYDAEFTDTAAIPLAEEPGRIAVLFEALNPLFHIRFEPEPHIKSFKLDNVVIESLGSWAVLRQAARTDPRTTLKVAGWRLTGKKVRARNRLRSLVGHAPQFNYSRWLTSRGTPTRAVLERLSRDVAGLASPPSLTLVLVARTEREALLEETLASLERQIGAPADLALVTHSDLPAPAQERLDALRAAGWAVAVVPAERGTNFAARCNLGLQNIEADYVGFLSEGDALSPDALARLTLAAARSPRPLVVYPDSDVVDAGGGRSDPRFKPDWDPEFLLHDNYVGEFFLADRQALTAAGGLRDGLPGAELYDLLLRVTDRAVPAQVAHVPHVLASRRLLTSGETPFRPSYGEAREAMRAAAADALRRRGEPASVTADPRGVNRVSRAVPDPKPLVSIVVPTRDRVSLLAACVRSVLERTDYPDFEILIADNDSREPATADFFRSLQGDARVRVVPYHGPFNFSAINNHAVRAAGGSLVLLLNNDTEVIHADWLRELVGHAVRPEVGAVGAKLLYPSGLVQHAGVFIGLGGLAGHGHRFYGKDHPGYMKRLVVAQSVSAVTAACLLVSRVKYWEVGGLDEEAFAVAYNDVDFCLKLAARGYRNVWTPHCVLYHKESASRARDTDRRNIERYRRESDALKARWGAWIAHDPFYNPNLTRGEDFSVDLTLEPEASATADSGGAARQDRP
jgi:GT2 family glycosyltransferase